MKTLAAIERSSLLHLSQRTIATSRTTCPPRDCETSTKCNLRASGHVGDRAWRPRSNGKCFVSTVSRKGPRKHQVKSSRLSRYDCRSRFQQVPGKKRDFRPKQDYKDSVSWWSISRTESLVTVTEKAIDLLRKSVNAK